MPKKQTLTLHAIPAPTLFRVDPAWGHAVTTLVTGAGIIGCHTAQQLAERGENVVLIDLRPVREAIGSIVRNERVSVIACDVTDRSALDVLVDAHRVTRIIHTAALLSMAIRQDPVNGVRVNVMGTMNLLELARQRRMERVVIASSTTIGYPAFGDFHGVAFPEDFQMKFIAQRPTSIYSATKVAVEQLALLYRDLYGVSTVSLRYAAVIGAWNGPGTSVPSRVLSSLVTPARNGVPAVIDDPLLVWEGGDEFIDARDCAKANLAALDATHPDQGVYNIGMGSLASFDDFVSAVRQLYPGLSVCLDVRPHGGFAGFPHVRRAPSDLALATRELGWRPAYGLQESVAFFVPHLGQA